MKAKLKLKRVLSYILMIALVLGAALPGFATPSIKDTPPNAISLDGNDGGGGPQLDLVQKLKDLGVNGTIYKSGHITPEAGTATIEVADGKKVTVTYTRTDDGIKDVTVSGDYELAGVWMKGGQANFLYYKDLTGEFIFAHGSSHITFFVKAKTHPPVVQKGELTVNKEWVGTTGSSVTVKLQKKKVDGDFEDVIVGGKTVLLTLNDGNSWTGTFKDLDLNATYKVEEIFKEGDYVASYSPDVELTVAKTTGAITVTNTKETTSTTKGSITVNKVYAGAATGPAVTVELYKEGSVTPQSITLGGDKPWTHTFDNLDLGVYKVKEVKVDGYKTTYSVAEGKVTLTNETTTGAVIITNTPTPPPTTTTTGSITVNKVYAGATTGSAVQVQLQKLVEGSYKNVGDPVTVTPGAAYTFTGLDYGTYKVVEVNIPTGYSAAYTVKVGDSVTNGNEVALGEFATYAVKDATVTITNTPSSGGGGGPDNPPPNTGDGDIFIPPTVDKVIPAEEVVTNPKVDKVEKPKKKLDEVTKVNKLPNTAEIPLQMFYGMSGILAGLGVYLGRKKK